MRLVQVEPQPVKWEHKLIFEVELENAGPAPFRIPWATVCDVNVDDPDLVTVDVSLMPVGYPDSDHLAFGVVFGSRKDTNTTRAIAPREKVRIRFASEAREGQGIVRQRLEGQPKVIVDIVARFAFVRGGEKEYAPLLSRNIVALEIVKQTEH